MAEGAGKRESKQTDRLGVQPQITSDFERSLLSRPLSELNRTL